MNAFCSFMASAAGRGIRIVAGIALIAWGFLGMEGTAGIIVTAIGFVPLLAGLFDVCLIGPLLGCPLAGSKVREQAKS